MTVTRRRFLCLATALVAINSFFWLAQSGFALPRAIIDQFFGGSMIRSEVLISTPSGNAGLADRPRRDHRHLRHGRHPAGEGRDRRLAPGRPECPRSRACARLPASAQLRRRLRVVIYRQADQPATLVQVEGVGG